ncbi:hypothetical protein CDL12_05040 [Handroanthus impetiginosus]|uniref:Uncharacterized protein n=1 Tax=Handroanthus impetiginosus TaxID=429701 RepID=A0A2G9HXK7_9LAMI|nr:hypothetical protein CDL12_05040 [Handroanthus impetiginosus]
MEDHTPLDTICEVICRDDPQWTLSRLNELIPFSRTKLTIEDCAVMIYAILTNVPFDIARFWHRSFWKSVMGGLSIGLYHPSLIIALCAKAGLERQLGDEMLQSESMRLWANQMNIPMSSCPHHQPDEPTEPPPVDIGDD